MGEFKALNTEVVGVSVDSHFSHLAWCNIERKKGGVGNLQYPLLSDITKKIAYDYGILLKDAGIALRGTFVIDKEVYKIGPGLIMFCQYIHIHLGNCSAKID